MLAFDAGPAEADFDLKDQGLVLKCASEGDCAHIASRQMQMSVVIDLCGYCRILVQEEVRTLFGLCKPLNLNI